MTIVATLVNAAHFDLIPEVKKMAESISIHAMIALWGNAVFAFDGKRWTVSSPAGAFNGVKFDHPNLNFACRQWAFDTGASLAWHNMSQEDRKLAREYAMSR